MYLEIVSVDVPSEANYGDTVTIDMRVKNKWTYRIFAMVTASYDGTPLYSTSHYIDPGMQRAFWLSFIMPDKAVTLWLWAWYWTEDQEWSANPDDEYGPIEISLVGAPPPEYTGHIGTINVNDHPVPQTLSYGDGFRIQFRGYLDSGERVRLWANIKVKSPIRTVYSHSGDLEIYPGTGVGGSHPFEFPTVVPYQSSITVDESGEWEVTIELRAGGATGPLLEVKRDVHIITVPAVVEPEYSGEIQNVQVRYGVSNWTQVPQAVSIGTKYSVAFEGINNSEIGLVLRGKITIGAISDSLISQVFGIPFLEDAIAPGGVYTFKFTPYLQPSPFTASETGDHTASIELEGKKPGETDSEFKPLRDPKEVVIVTVAEDEPAGFEGKISSVRVDWTMIAGGEAAIPTIGILGREARIRFNGSNDDIFPHDLCAKVWVHGPTIDSQPNLKYSGEGCTTVYVLGGFSHAFCLPSTIGEPGFVVDEEGEWNVKIRLEDSGGRRLDEYEGVLFTSVEKEPESTWGMLTSIMPLMMIMMMMAMIMPMTEGLGGEDYE